MKFDWIVIKKYIVVIEMALVINNLLQFIRKLFVTTETKYCKVNTIPIVVSITVIYMFP